MAIPVDNTARPSPGFANVTDFDAGALVDPDYRAALEHLYGRLDLERMDPSTASSVERDLEAYAEFLGELGDPHLAVPTIHFTGTRGKGSALVHLESILHHAGYRTGSTISPHLVEVRERIRLNGHDIGRKLFTSVYAALRPMIDRRQAENSYRTVFELITALAFTVFQRYKVEFALVEVGMGGRLDATNVVSPILSVLTRIGLDHTHALGGTIREIARDKAHIIKPGAASVISRQPPEAFSEIGKRADSVGSPSWSLDRDTVFEIMEADPSGSIFRLQTPLRTYENLRTPLPGRHQAENAAVAVLAADRLVYDGHANIDRQTVADALPHVFWPGRGEIIRRDPVILLDGAHTPQGAAVLESMLAECWPDSQRVMLMGFNRDKDIQGFIREFKVKPKAVITTAARTPRAMSPADAAKAVQELGWPARPADLPEAIDRATELMDGNDILVVTGSLYIVGAIRREFLRGQGDHATFLQG